MSNITLVTSEDVLNMVMFSVYWIVTLYVIYPPPFASGYDYRDASWGNWMLQKQSSQLNYNLKSEMKNAKNINQIS